MTPTPGRRDRTAQPVPAGALPARGQVVELGPGDVVPADARLLSVDGLEVDEASLTGESVAIDKQMQATPGRGAARPCLHGLRGHHGRGGHRPGGRGGSRARPPRPVGRWRWPGPRAGPAGMQARLEELTRRGLPITLLGGAAVTGLALLRGQRLRQAIASGVSVAVAAVPEGLPLVATVAQLGAARRLSARGVLVRSARTVEALGRVDTVCFDKTGTLTEGRLRLARVAGVDQQWAPDAAAGPARAARRRPGLPRGRGRPAAGARHRSGHPRRRRPAVRPRTLDADWKELAELPFQSDRGYSAAVGRPRDGARLVVKGAPEVLAAALHPPARRCRQAPLGRRRPRPGHRHGARPGRAGAAGAGRGPAQRHRPRSPTLDGHAPDPEELAEDLTLLGFVALADVARPEAAATIAALTDAGLRP